MLRLLSWLFGFFVFIGLIAVGVGAYFISVLSADLPDYTVLKDYQPPVTTRVHAADGSLLAEYARERRLFQPIETIPPLVVEAFLSAEDKNFYEHAGLSLDGLVRALRDNIMARVEGDNSIQGGGSTITQQVAKNFLLTSEQTWERKAKEALLALRIESTFSKDKILELYLNEIFMGSFGGQIYGVAAAALNYFDKALYELKLSEVAYLAALPKGANNYHPFKHPKAAIDRRNWVIDRMVENGYVSKEDGEAAKKDPLNVVPRRPGSQVYAAEYFTEEVRRELAKLYGEDQLYGGGLSVRTTIDPKLQQEARKALMDGLIAYDHTKGFRGPVATIDISSGDWGEAVEEIKPLNDVPEWTLAVVLKMDTNEATIGLRPGIDVDGKILSDRVTGQMPGRVIPWVSKKLDQVLNVGDVIYVSAVPDEEGIYTLEQVPEIEGAITAMDPRTGRVLAMVGGFSFDQSEFNRATQALRQPGSAIKPIVYSAALDNGYTPASVVLDAPVEIQNADGTVWAPQNYESGQYFGPQTLREGLVHSRNVMTVRLAKDIGMPLIVEYFKLFGIYDQVLPVLSMALGAGETTELKMVAAYATIANGGKRITPTLIDRVQDRYGKTIFKHDERICDGCNVDAWNNQAEPLIIDNREQVLDPMTAYQITSMMEDVVRRGTGYQAHILNRPVAGKTGTSSDNKDAWFVGFTPTLAVGVYIGYDTPKKLGRQTGGSLATPIFTEFMQDALKGKPATPFNMPAGMTQDWIEKSTGVAATAGSDAVLEAFKPGTGPNLVTSVIGVDSNAFMNIEMGQDADPNAGRGGLF